MTEAAFTEGDIIDGSATDCGIIDKRTERQATT